VHSDELSEIDKISGFHCICVRFYLEVEQTISLRSYNKIGIALILKKKTVCKLHGKEKGLKEEDSAYIQRILGIWGIQLLACATRYLPPAIQQVLLQ
jgi:hypothetical protein